MRLRNRAVTLAMGHVLQVVLVERLHVEDPLDLELRNCGKLVK